MWYEPWNFPENYVTFVQMIRLSSPLKTLLIGEKISKELMNLIDFPRIFEKFAWYDIWSKHSSWWKYFHSYLKTFLLVQDFPRNVSSWADETIIVVLSLVSPTLIKIGIGLYVLSLLVETCKSDSLGLVIKLIHIF